MSCLHGPVSSSCGCCFATVIASNSAGDPSCSSPPRATDCPSKSAKLCSRESTTEAANRSRSILYMFTLTLLLCNFTGTEIIFDVRRTANPVRYFPGYHNNGDCLCCCLCCCLATALSYTFTGTEYLVQLFWGDFVYDLHRLLETATCVNLGLLSNKLLGRQRSPLW